MDDVRAASRHRVRRIPMLYRAPSFLQRFPPETGVDQALVPRITGSETYTAWEEQDNTGQALAFCSRSSVERERNGRTKEGEISNAGQQRKIEGYRQGPNTTKRNGGRLWYVAIVDRR
jgi:hypothetical protein